MPTNYGILYDKDKRVRVYNNGTPVIASTLQSVYAKYLNYIGDRFTIAENAGLKAYDISLKYADKIIPYEGGVAQGSTPGYLDFNDTHFDVAALAGDKYVVTNPAYGKVLVQPFTTPRKLNFIGGNVVEDAPNDEFEITLGDTKAAVFNNSTQVGTVGRRLNFLGSGHSIVEDVPNDQFDIDLAYQPPPYAKKTGMVQGGIRDTDAPFGSDLFNLKHNYTEGETGGGCNNTHGHFRRYSVEDADNSLLGVTTDFGMTQLAFAPHLYGKMAISNLDDSRFIMGWSDEEPPTGDNVYLQDIEGYMIGFQNDTAETEDTQWQNILNDGDPDENKISTGVNLNSTTPFTFELVGEPTASPTPRWGFNVNGGAFTYRTTAEDTPQLNTSLNWNFRMETIGDDTGSLVIDVYYLYWTQNM